MKKPRYREPQNLAIPSQVEGGVPVDDFADETYRSREPAAQEDVC